MSQGEGKRGTTPGERQEPQGAGRGGRESCSLNSSRLFKARACSRAGAALIKDGASERPGELREEEGTHKTCRGVEVGGQHHFEKQNRVSEQQLQVISSRG